MGHMRWYERVISAAGGLMLIVPGLITDTVGIALVALMVLLQFTTVKKAKSLNA